MPFDSLCLAAAVQDCQTLLGCKITKINQPDKHTIMLRLYGPAALCGWILPPMMKSARPPPAP